MREDMAKVIVERPRRGGEPAKEYHHWNKDGDWDDAPLHEGMKSRFRHGGTKSLNENLAPLRRFLESSAERPWDNVYGEICERININSAVQLHIRQHIFDFVAKETYFRDGAVWVRMPGYLKGDVPVEDSFHRLYVHPTNGLLKKVVRPKGWIPPYKRRPKEELTRVDVSESVQHHKINGLWFRVELKPIDSNFRWDAVLRKSVAELSKERDTWSQAVESLWKTYGKSGVYGVSAKQLNVKELKAAGLKNDPPA